MLKQKNTVIALAVSLLLAACGGGGGDDAPAASTGTNTSSGSGTGISTGADTGTGGSTNTNPGTNTNTNAGSNTDTTTNTGGTTAPTLPADKDLTGKRTYAGQISTNGTPFDTPLFTSGIYSQAVGTHSPLKAFGIKLVSEDDPLVAGASGNGRIAIEFMEPASDQEEYQVAIDQVNYAITDAGVWTVTIPSTAKAYIHVKNGTGGVADLVVTNLPANLVRVVDVAGDPSSKFLEVNFDALMARATAQVETDLPKATVLNTVKDFKGTFNVNATYTALTVSNATGAAAPLPIDTVPITIKNSGLSAISGPGIKGRLYVVDCPPGGCV